MPRQLSVEISDDLAARIDIAVRASGMTKAAWVAQTLELALSISQPPSSAHKPEHSPVAPAILERKFDYLARILLLLVTNGNPAEFEKHLHDFQAIGEA